MKGYSLGLLMFTALAFIVQSLMATGSSVDLVNTPYGLMAMDGELPTQHTVEQLFYHWDLQQACQAFLWSLPVVSMLQWRNVHLYEFGAKSGDIVYYETYRDKLGIISGNANTPYIISFVELSLGPYILVITDLTVIGGLYDMEQRVFGAESTTKVGKYIILPPGVEKPEDASEYQSIQCPTMTFFFAARLITATLSEAREVVKRFKLYPYSERSNPPEIKVITPGGKRWYGEPPRGIKYWELLHSYIQNEPVHERDRLFMDYLHGLGIEKGKPFNPSAAQQKVLIDGAAFGELMAKANSFAKRFPDARYWSDRKWDLVWTMDNASMSTPYYDHFNKRAGFFYEAAIYVRTNLLTESGPGQFFLGAYTDDQGAWLDGAKYYTLRVPPNPPAKVYWSLNIYNVTSRCLIDNKQGKGYFFSLHNLTMNADGSYDFKFGPKQPQSSSVNNWVQTVPGSQWFVYLRLNYPLPAFFDKTWKLGDLKNVKYY